MGNEKSNSLVAYFKTKKIQSYTMIILLAVFVIILTILTNGMFITARNIAMLIRQMSIMGILSIGMVLIMIHGSIDLSVGSIMLVCSTLAAMMQIYWGWSLIPTLLGTLAIGTLIGMWNGFWVAYKSLPSFIVTLGSQLIFKGLSLAMANGALLGPLNKDYQIIGQAYIPKTIGTVISVIGAAVVTLMILNGVKSKKKFLIAADPIIITVIKIVFSVVLIIGGVVILNEYEGIASPVFILLILGIVFTFITNKTKFGRNLYAIGGNIEAALYSGIKIKWESFKAFMIMGILAATAGIVLTSRLNMATSTIGNMAELDAISACVIGGVSMAGGVGSIYGALAGALLIACLDNGMSLLNLDSFWQYVVKGVVLTIVVWYDISSHTKNK